MGTSHDLPMLAVEDLLMGRWRSIFLKDSSLCSSNFLLSRRSTNAAAKSEATRLKSSNREAKTSVGENILVTRGSYGKIISSAPTTNPKHSLLLLCFRLNHHSPWLPVLPNHSLKPPVFPTLPTWQLQQPLSQPPYPLLCFYSMQCLHKKTK